LRITTRALEICQEQGTGRVYLKDKGLAYKCDHCGGDPACVKECYPKANVYGEEDKGLRRLRGFQMKQRTEYGTSEEKRKQ